MYDNLHYSTELSILVSPDLSCFLQSKALITPRVPTGFSSSQAFLVSWSNHAKLSEDAVK
jgi:hypothetical protein